METYLEVRSPYGDISGDWVRQQEAGREGGGVGQVPG